MTGTNFLQIDNAFLRFMGTNFDSLVPKPYTSFDQVQHFSAKEFGDTPDGSHMNLSLVWKLDLMRQICGQPIYIEPYHPNGGFSKTGHVGSWHCHRQNENDEGVGFAADFHIANLSLEEMFRLAVLLRFSSIGVYPHWNNKGLHVDERPDPDGFPQLWLRNSSGVYVGLPQKYKNLLL